MGSKTLIQYPWLFIFHLQPAPSALHLAPFVLQPSAFTLRPAHFIIHPYSFSLIEGVEVQHCWRPSCYNPNWADLSIFDAMKQLLTVLSLLHSPPSYKKFYNPRNLFDPLSTQKIVYCRGKGVHIFFLLVSKYSH